MAIAILFRPQSMSAQQYGECMKRLEAAGAAAPAGRLSHACFGEGDRLQVFDIWESQQSFEAFGQTLMPILQQVGLDPGQPEIYPVHGTVRG